MWVCANLTYIKNIVSSTGFRTIFSKTIQRWKLTNLLNCLQLKLCSLSNQSRGCVKTFRALKLLQKVFFETKNKTKRVCKINIFHIAIRHGGTFKKITILIYIALCALDNNIICKTVLCVCMLIKLIESYRLEVGWRVVR